MKLSNRLKQGYMETAQILQGSERRLFMARVVKMLGRGGQRFVERELGWNRGTIRKGLEELESGVLYQDNFSARGRKPIEAHLPNLLDDMERIIKKHGLDGGSSRVVRISCPEIRRRLIREMDYRDADLPTNETLRKKVHQLGYAFL